MTSPTAAWDGENGGAPQGGGAGDGASSGGTFGTFGRLDGK